MSCSYAQAYHTLEFRHGPRSIVSPQTCLTFFLSESGLQAESEVLVEMKELGATIVTICNRAPESVRRASDLLFELEVDVPEVALLVPFIVPAQLSDFTLASRKVSIQTSPGILAGFHSGLAPDGKSPMTESHKFDLSVVGELNLDLVLYGLPVELELDHEHLASDLRLTLGSSSAIFAHNFALLGNRVGFNSAIGQDALGGLSLSRLAESGADVSAVRVFSGKQTGLTVILPCSDKRYILTYPGVMAEMRFEDLDLDHVLSASHLHLSSFFWQRALRPRVAELFRLAKQGGLSTSFDTNDDLRIGGIGMSSRP
jgi:hypothetical protein